MPGGAGTLVVVLPARAPLPPRVGAGAVLIDSNKIGKGVACKFWDSMSGILTITWVIQPL